MAQRPQNSIRRRVALTLLAGTCLGLFNPEVAAGLPNGTELQPADQATFDTISFPINPVVGEISAVAQAGWVWREGQTHRLQLVGDVQVVLAGSYFYARSASLWLKQLPGDQGDRYQIYAVFEDMRSADGTITMRAQRLPVRGVIELNQPISIGLDARFNQPPQRKTEAAAYLQNAERVFAERVLGIGDTGNAEREARPWSSPSDAPNDQARPGTPADGVEPAIVNDPTAPVKNGPVFDQDGIFSLSVGGRIVVDGVQGGTQSIVTADGGVKVQYLSPSSRRWIDFSAQRVVIYTRGDEPVSGASQLSTGQIEGIYLEGGVFAGDDQWSVRAPRMYLDVVNNKALMLDTVFWTTDRQSSMPLYVRAESVRQTARDEFLAENATI
ncbi:MAG: hypothetical protein NXI07_11110, partial [bacterium]|nr:hypothetical protein [bacterium]